MTIIQEGAKTFVTTVRVDIIDIAKIALFLEDNDYQILGKTKSKLASMATRLLSAQLHKYEVKNTEKAVGILRSLGYGESLMPGRRDFKPLLKQMSRENLILDSSLHVEFKSVKENEERERRAIVDEVRKNMEEIKPSKKAYDVALKTMVVDEPESKPESKPKKLEVKPRTPEDEAADIKRLRDGLGGEPPLAEEET